MSKHLDYRNHIVDLGRTIESTRQEFKSLLTAQGWQVLEETAATDAAPTGSFTVMPPASEEVGNELGADVLRLTVTGNSLTIRAGVLVRKGYREVLTINTNDNQPWYSPFIKVDGVRFNMPAPTNGKLDRVSWLDALATALATDARTKDRWILDRDAEGRIRVTAKDDQATGITDGDYGYARVQQQLLPVGSIIMTPYAAHTISIDLANSFAYYISIFERSFMIGTETTAGYYGPIAASWVSHEDAVRACPTGCMPLELLVCNMQDVSSCYVGMASSPFMFGHGYGHITGNTGEAARLWSPNSPNDGHLPMISQATNITLRGQNLNANSQCVIGLFNGNNRDRSSAATGVLTTGLSAANSPYDRNICVMTPSYVFPDMTVVLSGAPAQLKLALCRDEGSPLTLAGPLTDTDTSVTLADAGTLPAVGTLLIGDEVLTYTGRSGNTLSGLSRGKLGSKAVAAPTGATALAGGWYLRLNAGMIYCGSVKPGGVS